MNNDVKKALKELEALASKILTDCECILDDILDVEEGEDMFIIEASFERIKRNADDGYKKAQKLALKERKPSMECTKILTLARRRKYS